METVKINADDELVHISEKELADIAASPPRKPQKSRIPVASKLQRPRSVDSSFTESKEHQSLWRSVILAAASISGMAASAFLSTGLRKPMDRTFIIVGLAMAFVGALFGTTGLAWEFLKHLKFRRKQKAINAHKRSIIVEFEDNIRNNTINDNTVSLVQRFANHPDLVDDNVRSLLCTTVTMWPMNEEYKMDFIIRHLYTIATKNKDAVLLCQNIWVMWMSEHRGDFSKRITKLIESLTIYLDCIIRSSEWIGGRNLLACEQLIRTCDGLPRREQIIKYIEQFKERQIARQAAAFRRDLT